MQKEKEPFISIYSSDGHEFLIDEKIALECETFKKMLAQDSMKEGQCREIRLNNVRAKLLEKVIEYLYFKHRYTDSTDTIPEFPIEEDCVLDLLIVANYLNLS
eukprot:GEMP01110776.1.p1 GENE.GEMP01110776.1~~GEMP01110776.1.p1  ORF type:complete len:116 (+),score=15.69 GEMP01110776.1:42-350(+)